MTPRQGADPDIVRRSLDELANETKRKHRQEAKWLRMIRESRAAGASLRELSEVTGLNHQTIANKLNEGESR